MIVDGMIPVSAISRKVDILSRTSITEKSSYSIKQIGLHSFVKLSILYVDTQFETSYLWTLKILGTTEMNKNTNKTFPGEFKINFESLYLDIGKHQGRNICNKVEWLTMQLWI